MHEGESEAEPATVLDKPASVTSEPRTVHDKPPPREDSLPRPSGSSIISAPSLAGRSIGSQPSRGGATTVGSPVDALKKAEILATRNFARVGLAIAAGVIATVPLLPGHPTSMYVF